MSLPPPVDPKHPKPFLSHAPWAGFSPREHKRAEALPVCPSKRCRRLKRCVDAHGAVFCRRTHLSQAEFLATQPKFESRIANCTPEELELFRLDLEDRAAEAKERFEALTARWKAGEFDHLYGPWKAKGVLMHPPPRVYAEARRKPRGR